MGIIRCLLIIGIVFWANQVMSQRPRPHVISGGNPGERHTWPTDGQPPPPNKKWPAVGEYREKTQPSRATYTPPPPPRRERYGYYRRAPYCAAHRRTYYDPPGFQSVRQGVSYADLRRSVQSLAQ